MIDVHVVKEICNLLINDREIEAIQLAEKFMPFDGKYIVANITQENINLIQQNANSNLLNIEHLQDDRIVKKDYKKHIHKVFLRDGFIDRYTGRKLIFPGILFLLHFEMPEIFRYNKNWRPDSCHKIFWELYPTIDHFIAQTKAGNNEIENLITTLQVINTHKSNKNFEKLNWKIHPFGNLNEWDGLTDIFFSLMKKRNDYVDYKHIPKWETRYKDLKQWKNGMRKAQLEIANM